MTDIQLPTVISNGYIVKLESRCELLETVSGYLLRSISDSNNCLADVQFKLNGMQYEQFRSKYNDWVNDPHSYTEAADSLYCKLIIDTYKAINYKCRFVPETINLVSVNGNTFSVSCSLEVVTVTVTESLDDDYLDKCNTFGIESDQAKTALAAIVSELES